MSNVYEMDYDTTTGAGHDAWVDAMQSHNGHELVIARTTRNETHVQFRSVTVECNDCVDEVAVIDTTFVIGGA